MLLVVFLYACSIVTTESRFIPPLYKSNHEPYRNWDIIQPQPEEQNVELFIIIGLMDTSCNSQKFVSIDDITQSLNEAFNCTRCTQLYNLLECDPHPQVLYRIQNRGISASQIQAIINTLVFSPQCIFEALISRYGIQYAQIQQPLHSGLYIPQTNNSNINNLQAIDGCDLDDTIDDFNIQQDLNSNVVVLNMSTINHTDYHDNNNNYNKAPLQEEIGQTNKCDESDINDDLDGCQHYARPLQFESALFQNLSSKQPSEQQQTNMVPIVEVVEQDLIEIQNVQKSMHAEDKQPEIEEIEQEQNKIQTSMHLEPEEEAEAEEEIEELSLADLADILGRSITFGEDEEDIPIKKPQKQISPGISPVAFLSKNNPPEEQQPQQQQQQQQQNNNNNANNGSNNSGRVDLQRILTPIIASIAVLIIIVFICFTAKTIATK